MGNEIKPIRPDEITSNLLDIIPSAIIEATNSLLKEKYRGNGSVDIKQKDIVSRVLSIDESLTSAEIYDKRYLDIEKFYSEYGWNVDYDSPTYDENFDAYFTFNKK